MNTVADLLLILSFIALVVGLIKPKLFHKLTNNSHPRKKIGLVFGLGILVALIILAINAPADTTTANTAKKSNTSHTSATNASQPLTKAQAIAGLTSATDFYANLLQQGQQALGTQQYANGEAAITALNDPNSAASKWSTFNKTATSSDYFTAHVTQPYNVASDVFGSNAPVSLADWQNDMNQVDADLHTWVQHATSWQDSEITSSQLVTYTTKVQQDVAKARADIAAISR